VKSASQTGSQAALAAGSLPPLSGNCKASKINAMPYIMCGAPPNSVADEPDGVRRNAGYYIAWV